MRSFFIVVSMGFVCMLVDGCTAGYTTGVTNITATSATLNATGTCDATKAHPSCAYYFEYGVGDLATQTPTGTVGAGSNVVQANVTNLNPNTTYTWNACAEMTAGSGRFACAGPDGEDGSTSSFTTSSSPTASPDTATFPASYYSGPLGARNVLPKTSNGVLLGDWGGVQGYTWPQQEQFIEQREADMGRNFDLIGEMIATDGTLNGVSGCAEAGDMADDKPAFAHSQGAVPIIDWTPDVSLSQINSGSVDGCYKGMADYLEQFGYRIMLRIMWEFNGPWEASIYPCGDNDTSNGGPAAFVAAWRHIVNIFKAQGATNVGFWWVPGEGQDRTCADESYPGDAYVDWVGSDSYNWAGSNYNAPCVAGWSEFKAMFEYTPTPSCDATATMLRYPQKPFVVGETGSKYNSSDSNAKRDWFENIAAVAAPAMPNLHGIQFFDQDVVPEEGNDWRVNTDQTASSSTEGPVDANTYQGFIDMSHASVFNSGVAGGAT